MEKKFFQLLLGGNSFILNKAQSEEDNITPEGWEEWSNGEYVYGAYFKPAKDAEITLVMQMAEPTKAASVIKAGIGEVSNTVNIEKGVMEVTLGTWNVSKGYVEVKVQGISKEGDVFAFPAAIKVEGLGDEDMASYAKVSDKPDFYWIRRGPSVHCKYDISEAGDDVEWFYNEVTINPGDDPHGTYGMAIGFHGGYFGMQVCDEGLRKVLFSIWSPYNTDNPAEIPEDKMVRVLKKHPQVVTGEFGNEGSGGQSYINYNWESGKTYKFLCHIVPVADGKTQFTGYFFFPETGKWELLCSFLRPETTTYFKGPYSFLESFIDVNGNRFRRAHFSNQWAVTKGGRWFPVTKMKLTGDQTASRAQRQDYGGGIVDNHFYLNNCGFFSENSILGTDFVLDESVYTKPEIDLEALEKPC